MSSGWPWSLTVVLTLTALVLAGPSPVLAAVDWAPSRDVVVGEVVTGGARGSDEWIELYNASDLPVELGGLEIVYVTASGKTVTRKQKWVERKIEPRGRILVANVDGAFAAEADYTYSGGLSAAGGSVVLRVKDGAVIDSLSWGTAASMFVEGLPGVAPGAGSSLVIDFGFVRAVPIRSSPRLVLEKLGERRP